MQQPVHKALESRRRRNNRIGALASDDGKTQSMTSANNSNTHKEKDNSILASVVFAATESGCAKNDSMPLARRSDDVGKLRKATLS